MSSSSYADEGTVAHALATMCLTEHRDAAAYVGRVIECEDYEHSLLGPSKAHQYMRCHGSVALTSREPFAPRKFSLEVDDDMAEHVQTYVSSIRNYAQGGTLLVEQEVDVSHVLGTEQGGMADAIVILPDELQVHDLKFGRGVEVFAAENEQMQLYALGALQLVDLMIDTSQFKRVRCVIHQPRIKNAPDEWSVEMPALLKFADKAHAAAEIALALAGGQTPASPEWLHANGHLVVGDKQCRFCDAKATCPAAAGEVSRAVFGDADVIGNVHETAQPRLIPAGPSALGAFMDKVDFIEDWCTAVRAKGEALLFQGVAPIGKDGPYKLVAGKKGNRAWRDKAEAEAAVEKFRLKQDEAYNVTFKSPPQIEKSLKDSPKRWAKLQPLITQAPGKPHVAPATDTRPPYTTGASPDDFEDATQPERPPELQTFQAGADLA